MSNTLTKFDSDRFYSIYLPLLDYVNDKYKISPSVHNLSARKTSDGAAIGKITFELWGKRPYVLDEYLAEKKMTDSERQILNDWKRFISRPFIIVRHVQHGSVLLDVETEKAYVVSGITQSIEELTSKVSLPYGVLATLLPFNNRIITDGMLAMFELENASGEKARYDELYRKARLENRILTTI